MQKMKTGLALILLFTTIVVVPLIARFFLRKGNKCDLRYRKNVDIAKYYGLDFNYFAIQASENIQDPFYDGLIYEKLVDEKFWGSDSVIVCAPKGYGKTKVLKSLLSKKNLRNTILVRPKKQELSEYFEIFSKNMRNLKKDFVKTDLEIFSENWNVKHFAYLLLAEMTRNFAEGCVNKKFPCNLKLLDSVSKDALASVISFTSQEVGNDGYTRQILEQMFASESYFFSGKRDLFQFKTLDFVSEKNGNFYDTSDMKIVKQAIQDTEMYDFESLSNAKYLVKLQQLNGKLKIIESHNPYTLIEQFSSIVFKYFKQKFCIILDELDENGFMIEKDKIHNPSLEALVKSAIDVRITNLCRNAGVSSISIFFFMIAHEELQKRCLQHPNRDRIAVTTLPWNTNQLLAYVDFTLDILRERSSSACEPLPNFTTFLGGSQNADYLRNNLSKYVTNPRSMNVFIGKLFNKLEISFGYDNKTMFRALVEQIKEALEEAREERNSLENYKSPEVKDKL